MTYKLEDITCPTCNKPNTWTTENLFRPFCCERCKLIDLGDWADEKHTIPGQESDAPSSSNDSGTDS